MVSNTTPIRKPLALFLLTIYTVASFPIDQSDPTQPKVTPPDKNILLNVAIEALIQSPFVAMDELKDAFTTIAKYAVDLKDIFQTALEESSNEPGLNQLTSFLTAIQTKLRTAALPPLSISELQAACGKILGVIKEKRGELETVIKDGVYKIFGAKDLFTDEIQKFAQFMLTNCESLITNIKSMLYLDITGIGREVADVLEQIVGLISNGTLTNTFGQILTGFKGTSLTFLDGLKAILPMLEWSLKNPAITNLVTKFVEGSSLLFSFMPSILQAPFKITQVDPPTSTPSSTRK